MEKKLMRECNLTRHDIGRERFVSMVLYLNKDLTFFLFEFWCSDIFESIFLFYFLFRHFSH